MRKPNLLDLDLRLLKVFQTIVEEGGLTPAAYQLNVSVPTISNQLADLEARLGFTLCYRGRTGFALTEEGAQLYEAHGSLLSDLERFSEQVGEIGRSLVGSVHISTLSAMLEIPQVPLVKALQRFKDRSAHTTITLDIQPASAIEELLVNDAADVGISLHQRTIGNCDQRVLTQERLSLFCGRAHPLFGQKLDESQADHVLSYERSYRDYLRFSDGRRRKRLGVHTARANDLESIAILILTGRFLGYLPDQYARHWVSRGEMQAILPEHFSYENSIVLLTKRNKRLSKAVNAFIEDLLLEMELNAA